MYTSNQDLGFDFDFTALVPALTKGYTQYQQTKGAIQVERARATAAQEQARVAAAASAAARAAQARGGMWSKALPYAAAVGLGLGALYWLTRR